MCVLCSGCDKLSCLSNVHSSAQTLLLALGYELHPVTTLSPVLQPWQPSNHILSSKDTGYNTQSISVATLQCALSGHYAPYLRLSNHSSFTVALLKHCLMSAAALLNHSSQTVTQVCISNVAWRYTTLELMVFISLLTCVGTGPTKGS